MMAIKTNDLDEYTLLNQLKHYCSNKVCDECKLPFICTATPEYLDIEYEPVASEVKEDE